MRNNIIPAPARLMAHVDIPYWDLLRLRMDDAINHRRHPAATVNAFPVHTVHCDSSG